MSKIQTIGSFPSGRIEIAPNTRPVPTPEELPTLISPHHSKNVSKCSLEKEPSLNIDSIISSFEKTHLSTYPVQTINHSIETKNTALTYAVFQNDTQLVSRLLKSGTSPNGFTKSALRCTPIDIGVSIGNLEIVQLLCEAGAELNSKRSEILQRAAQRGDAEMITLLLDHGANIDHVPSRHDLDWLKPRSTALHESVRFLL